MARLRRVVVILVTLGTLLALSACATTAIPSVAASYKATFVFTPTSGVNDFVAVPPNSIFSLVLDRDGRFIMKASGHAGTTFKGTWSRSKSFLTLNSAKNQFIALVKGKTLLNGQVAYLGSAPMTYTVRWSAVRT
jgi:hypothetical protein